MFCLKNCLVFFVIFILEATIINADTIISAVNHNSADTNDVYVVSIGDMATGELVHIDRTHTFNTIPQEMNGLDYVLTANEDKATTGLTLDLSLNPPAKLYLSIDNRLGNGDITTNPPSLGTGTGTQWILDQGWIQTTQTWEKVGDAGHPYTVYTAECLADEITLFGQNAGNMYSIAAGPSTNTVFPYASIDIGPDAQRVEPGWKRLIEDPVAGSDIAYGPTSFVAKTFETLLLSTDEIDWRDRGNSTNDWDLVKLAEDFVKDNAGDISLTFSNLHQGHYSAKSYHIDSDTNQSPRIQVYVSDCVSSNRLLSTYGNAGAILRSVNLLTTEIIEDSAATFEFWANGIDPVIIRFRGTPGTSTSSGDTETPLNGIDLTLNTVFYPPLIESYALIDIGPSGQRPATNSIVLPDAPAAESNNRSYGPVSFTADDGSSFSLTIDNRDTNGVVKGGIDWRDRGDSTLTNDLSRLGEDFIKNNSGMIRITLGGLKTGTYRIVGFHNDSSNYQCENILVYVTDANGTAVLQTLSGDANYARRTINDITVKGLLSTATAFEVKSDGSQDVILYFDGQSARDHEVPLNGLQIEKVTDTSLPPVYPEGTLIMLR